MWVDCHERAVGVVANCFANAILKCGDWNPHVEGDRGGPLRRCERDVCMRKSAEELAGEEVGAVREECHASRVIDGKFERPFRERLKLQLLSLVLDRLVHLFDTVSEAFDWRVKYTGGLLGAKGLLELIADGRVQCFSLGVLSREFGGRAAPRCEEDAPAAVTVRIVEGAGSKDAYERRE